LHRFVVFLKNTAGALPNHTRGGAKVHTSMLDIITRKQKDSLSGNKNPRITSSSADFIVVDLHVITSKYKTACPLLYNSIYNPRVLAKIDTRRVQSLKSVPQLHKPLAQ
jgi:hypothetical protein